MKKICFLTLFICIILFFCLSPVLAAEQIRGYDHTDRIFQYVSLGSYPYEEDGTVRDVLWRVLTVEDDQALLLTENIIDARQIIFVTDKKVIENHTFRRISSYPESDLFAWLNSECLDTMFGNDPIRQALMEDPFNGYLHPLSKENYLDEEHYGFSKGQWGEELNAYPRRQAVATPYAVTNGLFVNRSNGKSPYWCIAIKNPSDVKFGLVGHNGHISWGVYSNTKVAGLRLAAHLNLKMVTVSGGSGTMESPFILSFSGTVSETVPSGEADEAASREVSDQPDESDESIPSGSVEEDSSAVRPEGSALISLLGDCSIGDAFSTIRSEISYHTVISEKGYAWPLSSVHDILSSDDLTVANLEVVLTERTAHKDIVYPIKGLPEHANVLKEGSVEAVNTVNNHCFDYYQDGYADTLASLDAAGIARFGSIYYKRKDGYDDILVQDVNGVRFGFFGISYPQNSDLDHIDELIGKLRTEEKCDVVIASMHWGREGYTDASKLTSTQLNLSARLIDHGVDVVYGHHPHVLQPMVFYKNKPILFSTGNFTFGTLNSRLDQHTAIFQLSYQKTGGNVVLKKLKAIPCMVGKKGDYRPVIIEETTEREKTLRILSPKRKISKFTNAPESFLTTGTVLFDDEGAMVED